MLQGEKILSPSLLAVPATIADHDKSPAFKSYQSCEAMKSEGPSQSRPAFEEGAPEDFSHR